MTATASLGMAPPGTYDVILKEIGPVKGRRILDIPGGCGGFARQLSNEGALCITSDISTAAEFRPAVAADMNSFLPFAKESFDIITCIEGVEHVHDPFRFTDECWRILRPDGRLVISTPNMQNMRSRLKFLLRGTFFWFDPTEICHIGHTCVLPYFLLTHIVRDAGFLVESVQANRLIFPRVPAFLCHLMQRLFSKKTEDDLTQNSSLLLNAEGLVVFARKKEPKSCAEFADVSTGMTRKP